MKAIEVLFEDEKYNYVTSINGDNKSAHEYFVGKKFNLCDGTKDDWQKCIGFRWVITTSKNQDLIPVVVFNAEHNTRIGAIYDPNYKAVLNIDHRPLNGNVKPFYSNLETIRKVCNSGLTPGARIIGIPAVHCHDNTFRLVEELPESEASKWL